LALAKKFAGNAGVEFLYISLDPKERVWKKSIDKHFQGKGKHFNSPGDWRAPIIALLPIQGIPFVAVYGKSGQLIDAEYTVDDPGLAKLISVELNK
jgi:hypothetical protein